MSGLVDVAEKALTRLEELGEDTSDLRREYAAAMMEEQANGNAEYLH